MVVSLVGVTGKKVKKVHRLVATTFIDNPENKKNVDHINNLKTDNRLINLRFATTSDNAQNTKLSIRNTSGCKGVSFRKDTNKWHASMQIDGIDIHIGFYDDMEDAKNARILRANQLFGVFTNACEKINL